MTTRADWPEEQTEAAQQQQGGSGVAKHLWEESWDDDDTSDDFSQQLKCVYTLPLFLYTLPSPYILSFAGQRRVTLCGLDGC